MLLTGRSALRFEADEARTERLPSKRDQCGGMRRRSSVAKVGADSGRPDQEPK